MPLGIAVGVGLAVLIVWLLFNFCDRLKVYYYITHLYDCKCTCAEGEAEVSADGTTGLTVSERQQFCDRLILSDLDVKKFADGSNWCAFDQESLVQPLCAFESRQLHAHRALDVHDVTLASFLDGHIYTLQCDAIADAVNVYLDALVQAQSDTFTDGRVSRNFIALYFHVLN